MPLTDTTGKSIKHFDTIALSLSFLAVKYTPSFTVLPTKNPFENITSPARRTKPDVVTWLFKICAKSIAVSNFVAVSSSAPVHIAHGALPC